MQRSKYRRISYLLMIVTSLMTVVSHLQAQEDNISKTLAGLKVQKNLQPTKDVFLEIDSCRVMIPDGALKQRYAEVEESLVDGLLIGWAPGWLKRSPQPHYETFQSALAETDGGKKRAMPLTPPPSMYLRSLQNDANVCLAAVRKNRSQASIRALKGVANDLDLKFHDCYLHGMSRLIPISVVTDKNTTPDAGWTIYFKWVTVSDIETTETAFPALSSPATDNLPPGIYQFRAQKNNPTSGAILKSEVKTVSLNGINNSCELQVP